MHRIHDELAAMEIGTFEIEEISDLGSGFASLDAAPVDGTACSNFSCCSTSTSSTSSTSSCVS
ncbi:thiazolylpeptide-type bacteriocin [Acrocarpospora sp. B8E8]|uniref:thiazolylpeptide-type bacteriocin n=1 Tax=Acrocarpospora sp. B8E8 TaxID=3153572 RepID=UPI00325F704A